MIVTSPAPRGASKSRRAASHNSMLAVGTHSNDDNRFVFLQRPQTLVILFQRLMQRPWPVALQLGYRDVEQAIPVQDVFQEFGHMRYERRDENNMQVAASALPRTFHAKRAVTILLHQRPWSETNTSWQRVSSSPLGVQRRHAPRRRPDASASAPCLRAALFFSTITNSSICLRA